MSDQSFGDTLTGGIQDISALLPLLGTEQCEDHVSSALTKGYLYSAATPISIFGSLGMARAGLKTLVASISSQRFVGARALMKMGFKPQGTDLSLIMRTNDSRYLVESRVDAMLKDLHIDNPSNVKPFMEYIKWNAKMCLATITCCILSILPYTHPSLGADMASAVSQLRFPIIKAVGGFLVATMVQLLVRNRILVIVAQSLKIKAANAGLKELGMSLPKDKNADLESELQDLERHIERYCERYPKHIHDANNGQWNQSTQFVRRNVLANWCNRRKRSSDIEKGRRKSTCSSHESFFDEFQSPTQSALEGTENPELVALNTISRDQYRKLTELRDSLTGVQKIGLTHFWTIVFSALLLAGVLAVLTGYIGCFSVVQGSKTPEGPLVWLGLETTLSIIRLILWGWNRNGVEPPLFTLDFEPSSPPLSPTCDKFTEDFDKEEIIPLLHDQEFLKSI